jgi:hypothetical protein
MGVGDRRGTERRAKKNEISSERRSKPRRTKERRDGPRIPLELWMEELAGDDVYFRRTGNVGEGGVFFDSAIPHERGTMLTLKFTLPGDKEMVVARGKVVNGMGSESQLGMGVKFVSIEGDGAERIREHILKLT